MLKRMISVVVLMAVLLSVAACNAPDEEQDAALAPIVEKESESGQEPTVPEPTPPTEKPDAPIKEPAPSVEIEGGAEKSELLEKDTAAEPEEDLSLIPARMGITDPKELEIIQTVWQHDQDLYGDRVSGFQLYYFKPMESGTSVEYSVHFGKTYGVDGFIIGARVGNGFKYDEWGTPTVTYSTLSSDPLADFDPAPVSDLTKETLLEIIEPPFRAANPHYEGDDTELAITDVGLIRKDEGFQLQIAIAVTQYYIDQRDGTEKCLESKEAWYYPIPTAS